MKKLFIIIILCFASLAGKTQNFVVNPGFENICTPCNLAMGVSSSCNWYYGALTPDYFNTCVNSIFYPMFSTNPVNCYGYQQPRAGIAYGGMAVCAVTNLADTIHFDSEYMTTNLNDTLIKDHYYYGEFYMSLANLSNCGINQIGMYLTSNTFTTAPNSFTNTIQPQILFDSTQCFLDTSNWVKVSGCFKAQGGESHLTLGNFKDGNHIKKQPVSSNFVTPCGVIIISSLSYVYVDDVSLYELPLAKAIHDTVLCKGDTIVIGWNQPDTASYFWQPATGLSCTNCANPIAIPQISTSYTVTKTMCNFQSTDVVTISVIQNCDTIVKDVIEPDVIIPNVFTPNNDSINDVWRFSVGERSAIQQCKVYNRWGNLVYSTNEKNAQQHIVLWDGRTTSGEPCSEGVYYYVLQYININGEEKKENGYLSLFR